MGLGPTESAKELSEPEADWVGAGVENESEHNERHTVVGPVAGSSVGTKFKEYYWESWRPRLPRLFEAEEHDSITEGVLHCNERHLGLVLLNHPDLVVQGEDVHEGELHVARGVVNEDFDVGLDEGELVVLEAVQTLLDLGHATVLVKPFPEAYGLGLSETFLGWVRIVVSSIWIRVELENENNSS
ncbi:hypothetical protein CRG98_038465 [Punica granatum]|uniref:Uncharacterized protein n=1 Tax=Punica granatum TaxID=22663 RepID=A0A2I0IAW9_PUNGR|nr:hypothetical protein CRG98_038465 [Punica granatum]